MDKEGIFVLSQEEVEFLELLAEASRAAAMLPMPVICPESNVDEASRAADELSMSAIFSGSNVNESSNTLSSDEVNVNRLPTESVCSESESEARVNAELIIPILRHVENVTVLQLYTKSVIHVEILIPPITYRNIRMTQNNADLFYEMPITPRAADIRTSLKFSMTVLFSWRVADKSLTSLFVSEITESHLLKIPLCLGNSIELANALQASAIRNALKLPMTVTFLRRNTDIVSTSFFGGSSIAQIRVLGCESSILGEVEKITPPTKMIIERNPELRNSLPAYESADEAQSQQSSCTSTLEVIVSDNTAESEGDEIWTMAEIKPAEQPEEWPNIQRKSFLKRLGKRLLKIGKRLCCCYCSKLD
ncbi:Uncharacterized protein FWK35_00038782 [Aphis craccivora]|uniref:Uncharacterized protein n=1 Tax=Aphis craccivora TaxID=307492 RepID=A0A6G0WG86_APHCR|nr:Uncharacterized protein FWK35_00038782 [Aphis craccivora]